MLQSAAAASLPIWSVGCGGDESSPPDSTSTKNILHVDLNFADGHSAFSDEHLHLEVMGRRYPLRRHDEASRGELASTHPLGLNGAGTASHFALDVEVPDETLTLMHVVQNGQGETPSGHLATHLYLPAAAHKELRDRVYELVGAPPSAVSTRLGLRRRSQALGDLAFPTLECECGDLGLSYDNSAECVDDSGTAFPEGDPDYVRNLAQQYVGADQYVSHLSTPVALLFHHPRLFAVDPSVAVETIALILSSPYLCGLNGAIASQGAGFAGANDPPGWCYVEPVTDSNGQPLTFDDGTTSEGSYEWIPTQETLNHVRPVLHDVLSRVQQSPALEGTKWFDRQGTGNVEADTGAAEALSVGAIQYAASQTGTLRLNSSSPCGSRLDGIQLETIALTDAANREVSFTIRNYHLRYFGAYVEFIDDQGNPISMQADGWDAALPDSPFLGSLVGELEQASWQAMHDEQGRVVDKSTEDKPIGVALAEIAAKLLPLIESDQRRLIDLVSVPSVLLGIPTTHPPKSFKVRMPANAVEMRIHFGSVGVGGWNLPMSTLGAVMTVIMQLVLPAVFLVLGLLASTVDSIVKALAKSPGFWFGLIMMVFSVYEDIRAHALGDGSSTESVDEMMTDSLVALLDTIANLVVELFATEAFILVKNLVRAEAGEVVLTNAFGPLRWALMLANAAAYVGDITATSVEIGSNPSVSTLRLTLSSPVELTIKPDPDHGIWPADASVYRIIATPRGGTPVVLDWQPMPDDTDDTGTPIVVGLENLVTGRHTLVTVQLRSAAGCAVGNGTVEEYVVAAPSNLPTQTADALASMVGESYDKPSALKSALVDALGQDDADQYFWAIAESSASGGVLLEYNPTHNAAELECVIREKLISLNTQTVFTQRERLVVDAGKRTWSPDAPTPTATHTDTNCDPGDGNLCRPLSLAVSQRTFAVGYSWRSASQAMTSCDNTHAGSQLYAAQMVDTRHDAQQDFQVASNQAGMACARSIGAFVLFDLLGSSSGHGRNIVIDGMPPAQPSVPSSARTGFVREVALDGSQWRVFDADKSLGVLTRVPEDAALHHSGVVVALHRPADRLEFLHLADSPRDDSQAPRGSVCSGHGSALGLLDGAVAVATGLDETFYVLEQGSWRVQAFDRNGSYIERFGADKSSATFALDGSADTPETLVDMDVDFLGFVYVLSYIGSGSLASDYRLSVYSETGQFLCRTGGIAAAKICVDRWRNVFALNYEKLTDATGNPVAGAAPTSGWTEPSLSIWTPDMAGAACVLPD